MDTLQDSDAAGDIRVEVVPSPPEPPLPSPEELIAAHFRGRLRACKGLGGVEGITHRVELHSLREVDAEVVRWMKRALETRS